MNKNEIKYLSEQISEKERIITCFEEAMMSILQLVKGNFDQCLLQHSTDNADEFISFIYCEVRDKMKELYGPRVHMECEMPAAEEIAALKNRIDDMKKECERLKHRNLWQRIFNR